MTLFISDFGQCRTGERRYRDDGIYEPNYTVFFSSLFSSHSILMLPFFNGRRSSKQIVAATTETEWREFHVSLLFGCSLHNEYMFCTCLMHDRSTTTTTTSMMMMTMVMANLFPSSKVSECWYVFYSRVSAFNAFNSLVVFFSFCCSYEYDAVQWHSTHLIHWPFREITVFRFDTKMKKNVIQFLPFIIMKFYDYVGSFGIK